MGYGRMFRLRKNVEKIYGGVRFIYNLVFRKVKLGIGKLGLDKIGFCVFS